MQTKHDYKWQTSIPKKHSTEWQKKNGKEKIFNTMAKTDKQRYANIQNSKCQMPLRINANYKRISTVVYQVEQCLIVFKNFLCQTGLICIETNVVDRSWDLRINKQITHLPNALVS